MGLWSKQEGNTKTKLMAVTANRTQQFWVVYLGVYCIIVVYCETYVSLNANVHIRLSIQYSFGMFWSIVPEKTNILFPFWPSRWGLLLSRWYYSFLLCQYSYCLLTLTHILLPGGVKGDVPVIEICIYKSKCERECLWVASSKGVGLKALITAWLRL